MDARVALGSHVPLLRLHHSFVSISQGKSWRSHSHLLHPGTWLGTLNQGGVPPSQFTAERVHYRQQKGAPIPEPWLAGAAAAPALAKLRCMLWPLQELLPAGGRPSSHSAPDPTRPHLVHLLLQTLHTTPAPVLTPASTWPHPHPSHRALLGEQWKH